MTRPDDLRGGLWRDPAIPKAGWECIAVNDQGEPSDICEMCQVAEIRYVHVMVHPDHAAMLRVGCICAGRMEGAPEAARARERPMRRRAARLDRFLARAWRRSARGNEWTRVRGLHVVVYPRGKRWSFAVEGRHCGQAYATTTEAKAAAFAGLEWIRQRTRQ